MSRLLAMLTAATVVLVAAATATAAGGDGVWVNGKAEHLQTGPPPANPSHPATLYVIAPISTAHPLHSAANAKPLGFGAHDHVIAPPKGARSFKGTCDLHLVVPGPKGRPGSNIAIRRTLTPVGQKPLLYAARLGKTMLPFNAATRIQAAVRLGLAMVVNTHTVISCAVSP